jgi:hypothetical protein
MIFWLNLTLIEAIADREKAKAVARDLGVETWDMRHASGAFKLNRAFATTVLANRASFWNRDTWGIELQPGMDEASPALVADAWSRTYRSQTVTFRINIRHHNAKRRSRLAGSRR